LHYARDKRLNDSLLLRLSHDRDFLSQDLHPCLRSGLVSL
jgi:hypothetical protein